MIFNLIVGLASIFQVFSTDTIVIRNSSNPYINDFVDVYIAQDTLAGPQAWNAIQNGQLTKLNEQTNPGMTKNAGFWLHFTIQNPHTTTAKKYLEVLNPQLDTLKLFEIIDSNPQTTYVLGDHFPFDQRVIKNRNFILPIAIEAGQTKTFLLNIDKRASATDFPLKLYDEDAFPSKVAKESIFFGIYFGVIGLIVLLSFLIGVISRLRVFIFYGLYVSFFGLWFFSREGFSYQLITSDFPGFNTHFYPMCTSLATMFLIIYLQSFFNTRSLYPLFHKIMSGLVGIFVVGFIIWALFPDQYIAYAPGLFTLRYVMLLMTIAFAYASAIKSLKTSPLKSKLFLFGYTVFFLGMIIEISNEYGLVNIHQFLIPPIMVGYFVEVLALSAGMSTIVYGFQRERTELAIDNTQMKDQLDKIASEKKRKSIVLNSKVILDHNNIRYIKSDDHYLEFYLVDKERPELDRNTIKHVLSQLPSEFVQIHRSIIVNISQISVVSSTKVKLKGGESLNLSRSYKGQLNDIVKN